MCDFVSYISLTALLRLNSNFAIINARSCGWFWERTSHLPPGAAVRAKSWDRLNWEHMWLNPFTNKIDCLTFCHILLTRLTKVSKKVHFSLVNTAKMFHRALNKSCSVLFAQLITVWSGNLSRKTVLLIFIAALFLKTGNWIHHSNSNLCNHITSTNTNCICKSGNRKPQQHNNCYKPNKLNPRLQSFFVIIMVQKNVTTCLYVCTSNIYIDNIDNIYIVWVLFVSNY